MREVDLLKSLDHPNIVRLQVRVCSRIVLKAEKGSLPEYLHSRRTHVINAFLLVSPPPLEQKDASGT